MRLLNFFKSILDALRELFFGIPKSDTGNKLRDFLIDLSNNDRLREKYAEDPVGVMDKYGLSDDEKKWIEDGNTEEINKHIGEGYSSVIFINVTRK